jgi:RHS repeat-associated protein
VLQGRSVKNILGDTLAKDTKVFYFAGRPVGLLEMTTAPVSLSYLSVDHLETPILETSSSGASLWSGGFEPFGKDWNGAQAAGQFLRFPGQWEDTAWAGGRLYYNLNRWHQFGTGRYSMPDPLRSPLAYSEYLYVLSSPVALADRLGLLPDDSDILWQLEWDNACALGWAKEGHRRGSSGLGWRWAHCWTSCMIDTTCGRRAARVTEIEKEILDVFKCAKEILTNRVKPDGNCWSAFQPSDFEDNARGRACPKKLSCDQWCSAMPHDLSPPGPFFFPFLAR